MSGWLAIATASRPTSCDRNSSQHWCSSSSTIVGSSWFVIRQASDASAVGSTAEGPDSGAPTVAAGALRLRDLTTTNDMGMAARRMEDRRRAAVLRDRLDLRPPLPDHGRLDRGMHGGL